MPTKKGAGGKQQAYDESTGRYGGFRQNTDYKEIVESEKKLAEKPKSFIGLQLFAEKDLQKQNIPQLKKGIRNLQKQLALHEDKIKNPQKYYPEWEKLDDIKKSRSIKGWKFEISQFRAGIERREKEILKREKGNE